MPPSRIDVENLKEQWMNDPSWDIYDTEGYEAYREELRQFQEACATDLIMRATKARIAKAKELGILNNTKLLTYLLNLEARIAVLEAKLDS